MVNKCQYFKIYKMYFNNNFRIITLLIMFKKHFTHPDFKQEKET